MAADFSVQDIGGKDKLTALLTLEDRLQKAKPNFEKAPDRGGINLVVFDADTNPAARREEIERVARVLGLTFETFLLPNDTAPGALEAMLCQCVPTDNQVVLACFDGFKECVRTHGRPDRPFHLPLDKSKVFAYLEAVIPHSKRELMQDGKRDYLNPDHWNLEAAYLQPLRDFLTRHLLG